MNFFGQYSIWILVSVDVAIKMKGKTMCQWRFAEVGKFHCFKSVAASDWLVGIISTLSFSLTVE